MGEVEAIVRARYPDAVLGHIPGFPWGWCTVTVPSLGSDAVAGDHDEDGAWAKAAEILLAPPKAPPVKVVGRVKHERHDGWWWGAWQDGRLVGFGAGYSTKPRCMKAERACVRLAKAGPMPTVECTNPTIQPFR